MTSLEKAGLNLAFRYSVDRLAASTVQLVSLALRKSKNLTLCALLGAVGIASLPVRQALVRQSKELIVLKGPKTALIAVCVALTALSELPAQAGDQEDRLINKIVAAYGGEAFTSVKTIRLQYDYMGFRRGQSFRANEVDRVEHSVETFIDMENRRKSFRWIRDKFGNTQWINQVFNGEKGYSLDHEHKTISENSRLAFASTDARASFLLDTAMVAVLLEARASAEFVGDENYRGMPHQKLSFQAEGFPKFTMLVNAETGLVSRMTRPDWGLSYQYSGHTSRDGIRYAARTYVTRGGEPPEIVTDRTIEFNVAPDDEFIVPQEYGPAPENIDFSQMSVQQVSEGVYLAGRRWGFSLFVDAGDYLIATGGYRGLTQRYEAVKAFAGIDKPLKYQVVSHHHSDHLGGMKEAAELGVQFIAAPDHIEAIRAAAGVPIADDRFIHFAGNGTFGDGKLQLVNFVSDHATHNLWTYVPSAKLIFTVDFYRSRQETGAPKGRKELPRFKEMLEEKGLDVDLLAEAHSGRILTASDLDWSLQNMAANACPPNWRICRD